MEEHDEIAEPAEMDAARSARIQDVARLAGVSTATVSRALARPERVSATTRAKVLSAVQRTGYLPNPSARSLRSQKTRMVLVVLPNLDNIFFSKILCGIEDALFEAGYGMIIGDLDGAPAKEAHFAAFAAGGQVDGVLLLNGHLFGQSRDGKGVPARIGVPTVALCEAIPHADIPQIEVDNRAGARRMTRYLASLGHRHIAYVHGPAGNILERERLRGYRDGLRNEGLAFSPALVIPGDYSLDAGAAAGEALLALAERPTAVFCANDEMAIGLIRSLVLAGVRVPQDISVAGFDDIEFSAMVQPALTTVAQPRRELGRVGAQVLVDLLAGRPAPARRRLQTKLVIRASTAQAPRRGGRHDSGCHRHRREPGHRRRHGARIVPARLPRRRLLPLGGHSRPRPRDRGPRRAGLGHRTRRHRTARRGDPDAFRAHRRGRQPHGTSAEGRPPRHPGRRLALGLDMVLLNVVRMARLVTPHMEARQRRHRQHLEICGLRARSRFSGLGEPADGARRLHEALRRPLRKGRHPHEQLLPGFIDSLPEKTERTARIPMGRYGSVGEIAKTVAFLLSSDAGYITGQNILADGGLVAAPLRQRASALLLRGAAANGTGFLHRAQISSRVFPCPVSSSITCRVSPRPIPGGKKVLENVHLSFYPDAKIGVLGVNGSGKSTLLRIMAGHRQGVDRRGLGRRGRQRRLPAAGAAARSGPRRCART